ncbi:helix-turn-helix domain-containing protein [Pseudomonas tussilaginis]|uniref:helix-turn-helix domain-containing protein n=1 Tax=Pseudomonas sp. 5 TaxID=1619949 RepID=UPI0005EBDD79|nr:helix-turn-helix transcriptional regulator [Pseudomonas sp. 5]KJK05330.1 LuxR family transcriptional regulator [Pseudomonas sp. 5]
MEPTIINGAWKGHLGRGLAPRELECVLSVAQGKTAKEIARVIGIAPCSVAKRITAAMFKLGVNRRAALVAEAMKRQIISPLCIALAGLMAMHAAMGDADPVRRDRRPPERRTAEIRIIRKAESFDLHV